MAIWRLNVYADFLGSAGRCVNTWHVRTGNLVTTETAAVNNAAAEIVKLYTAMRVYTPSTTGSAWKCDFAVNEETSEDIAIDQTRFAPQLATGGASVAPPHLAVCVGWKTSIRARRGRGRTFLGPLTLGSIQSDGTVLAQLLTDITTALNTLVTASKVDNDWAVGIWGLENQAPSGYGGNYADLPHVIRDVTGFAIQDKFAVMRSRRP